MKAEAAISRSVLSEQVKERLVRAILDGRYAPGDRIVETRVARELGTSQAPVREALRDLEALGLIEAQPFRGARVRRPSTAELLEAFAVRTALETLAARLAMEHLVPATLLELQALVDAMRAAAARGDVLAEVQADAEFHGCIITLSGNRALARVWRQLEPYSRTFITISTPGADRQRIAEVHAPIVTALERRDGDAVTAAIDDHFAELTDMVAALWSPDPDPQSLAAPASLAPQAT
jgi:DNA-binding GntR family transcriptional regulator